MKIRKARNRELIEEHFSTIWPAQIAGFTRFIVQLRKAFDGDLDMMVVLAVIGDRTRPENWARELVDYRSLTRDGAGERRQEPLNVQSISDFTGIPRETVRRKIAALETRGWIRKDEKGHITALHMASSDLKDATGEAIEYLSTIATAFDVARENAVPAPNLARDGKDR
jgi:CRP-like cAMP-binding protein